MMLAMTVVWGSTFSIVKVAMQDISPVLFIALRFLLAGTLIGLAFRRRIFPLTRPAIQKGCLLGLFLFLGFVPQNIGLTMTTASKSAFITGMMVVFVPLLQIVVERRAPKLGNVLGVLVVSLGLWFLTSPSEAAFNAGDALMVVCAILFAVYIVYLDVVSREMNTEQLVFLQMVSTGAFSWITVALFEPPVFTVSSRSISALLYLTVFATVLTTYVQTRYQKETTPTRAVIIFSVEPVVAAIIAYFLLGERMGALGIFGGALIVAGVLVSELSDGIPILNRSVDTWEP
jgi:drug/metabolite transporter (DMT)-like permease